MKIEQRMKELKLQMVVPTPAGIYRPAIQTGNLVMTSGQLPFQDQRLVYPGRVGNKESVTTENAQRAARVAVVNCLAAVKSLIGDLDRVQKIVRMNGYVCSALGYTDQPRVMDGASELLVDIFGAEIGSHTRCAIGVFELPRGSSVEIDLTVQVSDK